MSIRDILRPETKDEAWSKLYCYQINAGSATIDGTVDFDGDVHVAGQLTVGPNDFQVANGVGLAGQTLKTNGGGVLNWEPDDIGSVVFKPGSLSSSGIIKTTWQEVVDYVAYYRGACVIYFDDSIVSPCVIDADIDCRGRTEFYPGSFSAGAAPQIQIAAGVRIKNPRAFRGPMTITAISIGVPSFNITMGQLIEIVEGAALTSDATSDIACFDIADGAALVLSVSYGGGMGKNGAVPVINVGIGSTLIFTQIVMANQMGLQNDIISSTDGTATMIMGMDSSCIHITNAAYTGVVIEQSIDKSSLVVYDDSADPVLGSTTVQGAIDVLKERPTSRIGFCGEVTAVPQFLATSGGSAAVLAGVAGVDSQLVATSDLRILALSYNTASADGTTEYKISVNNVVVATSLATGASGVLDGFDLAVLKGQKIDIQQSAGTLAGDGNYSLEVQ